MLNVYDDFIPLSYQNVIENIISDEDMLWRWKEHMDGFGEGLPTQLSDVYVMDDDDVKSDCPNLYHTISWLLCKIVDEVLPDYELTRIRAVLQTPIPGLPTHYVPHVDAGDTGEMSVVYYPHNATGDTFFFEEMELYDRRIRIKRKDTHDWKPVRSVSPKKGRLVVFPSNQYHAGSAPMSGRRMLINCNYLNTRRNII